MSRYLEYLEAYFHEDQEELDRIENAALAMGYGPVPSRTSLLKDCIAVAHDHWDDEGHLIQPTLIRLECEIKFIMYQPVEEHRQACPYVLVISSGVHDHPILLPQKMPQHVREQISAILKSMDDDLPDMTPRRFLRHPLVKSYLQGQFPNLFNPTLIELHTSLANHAYLNTYITAAKVNIFPAGTGWKGVKRLKEWQDANVPPEQHYIRKIVEIADFLLDEFDEDSPVGPAAAGEETPALRYITCMSPIGSERLLRAQYLQSDIGFKHIEGFLEFETAAMANTSLIFLRIYVNRQTAAAHQLILQEIERIVEEDTGMKLKWHHLHANSPTATPQGMILQWMGDQHGGQAKVLGYTSKPSLKTSRENTICTSPADSSPVSDRPLQFPKTYAI
ncbi:hypothetical protein FB451DRAFT_1446525 [Mycena latifolia]|nr:hypothetical protein FB451DRAFT_1446525 [Mycena latifolia]